MSSVDHVAQFGVRLGGLGPTIGVGSSASTRPDRPGGSDSRSTWRPGRSPHHALFAARGIHVLPYERCRRTTALQPVAVRGWSWEREDPLLHRLTILRPFHRRASIPSASFATCGEVGGNRLRLLIGCGLLTPPGGLGGVS